MIKIGAILWLVLAAASGYGLFRVKSHVQELERELAEVNEQIDLHRESLRVLEAEWSLMNHPSRLHDLAQRHLGLVPITGTQMIHIEDLPWRQYPAMQPPSYALGSAGRALSPASLTHFEVP